MVHRLVEHHEVRRRLHDLGVAARVERGAHIGAATPSGGTAIHAAFQEGHHRIVVMLNVEQAKRRDAAAAALQTSKAESCIISEAKGDDSYTGLPDFEGDATYTVLEVEPSSAAPSPHPR